MHKQQQAAAAANNDNRSKLPINNPHREDELLDAIDRPLFDNCYPTSAVSHSTTSNNPSSNLSFDPSLYQLEKLSSSNQLQDVNIIHTERQKLREQLYVVSKRVNDLILKGHPSYSNELKITYEVQQMLQDALCACIESRRGLKSAQPSGPLRLLALHRKRQRLAEALQALHALRTLKQTDERVRELATSGAWIEAAQLCAECQLATSTYAQYSSVCELRQALQSTHTTLTQQSLAAFQSLPFVFQGDMLEGLVAALCILGQQPLQWLDHLLQQYSLAIQNATFKETSKDHLAAFCAQLYAPLYSFAQLQSWAKEKSALLANLGSAEQEIDNQLSKEKTKLFDVAACKLSSVLMTSSNQLMMGYEQFLQTLRLASLFLELGRRFFDPNGGARLQKALGELATNYLHQHYHHQRREELHLHIDSESWQPCPLRRHCRLSDFLEWAWLSETDTMLTTTAPETDISLSSQMPPEDPFQNLMTSSDGGGGGDVMAGDMTSPDVGHHQETNNSSDEDEEFSGSSISGVVGSRHHQHRVVLKPAYQLAPVVSNSAIFLLRLCGRYAHVMQLCGGDVAAFDWLQALSQLFDYFAYSVWLMFGRDWPAASGAGGAVPPPPSIDLKLVSFLQRVRQQLGCQQQQQLDNILATCQCTSCKQLPRLCPSVQLTTRATLFALQERFVAVESVLFLANQLSAVLRDQLCSLVARSRQAFVTQFQSQTLDPCLTHFRTQLFSSVGARALQWPEIARRILEQNWQLKSLSSHTSPYIQMIVGGWQELRADIQSLRLGLLNLECCQQVWLACVGSCEHCLLHAYAQLNCSQEGRALLQLDVGHLEAWLNEYGPPYPADSMNRTSSFISSSTSTSAHPFHHRHPVAVRDVEAAMKLSSQSDTNNMKQQQHPVVPVVQHPVPVAFGGLWMQWTLQYLKAYFLPEEALLSWFAAKPPYSPTLLQPIVTNARHVSTKTKQRLLQQLQPPSSSTTPGQQQQQQVLMTTNDVIQQH